MLLFESEWVGDILGMLVLILMRMNYESIEVDVILVFEE